MYVEGRVVAVVLVTCDVHRRSRERRTRSTCTSLPSRRPSGRSIDVRRPVGAAISIMRRDHWCRLLRMVATATPCARNSLRLGAGGVSTAKCLCWRWLADTFGSSSRQVASLISEAMSARAAATAPRRDLAVVSDLGVVGPMGPPRSVERFLRKLSEEQTRFLIAIADAAVELGDVSDDLRRAAAEHVVLSRRFLDGQRALLRRRADVAATLDEMDRAAIVDRPIPPRASTTFDPMFERQRDDLARLLDRWWDSDGVQCAADVSHATARASISQRLADAEFEPPIDGPSASLRRPHVEVDERANLDERAERPHASTLLPPFVFARLAATTSMTLIDTLDGLITSLVGPSELVSVTGAEVAEPSPEPPSDPADLLLALDARPDTFDSFWLSAAGAPPLRKRRRLLSSRLPMALPFFVAAVSSLTLLVQ